MQAIPYNPDKWSINPFHVDPIPNHGYHLLLAKKGKHEKG